MKYGSVWKYMGFIKNGDLMVIGPINFTANLIFGCVWKWGIDPTQFENKREHDGTPTDLEIWDTKFSQTKPIWHIININSDIDIYMA